MARGIIIAAPSSGSGKTSVVLWLLRLLARQGLAVASAKVGPDYIDPAFHAAASGRPCFNLDGWAMRPDTVAGLAAKLSQNAELVICEGVMGLFDGAFVPPGQRDGSTADLAELTGWPVVLVIDARGMAGSAAAVLTGFARLRSDIAVKGVIFNRVSGERHRAAIAHACQSACPDIRLLGFLPSDPGLEMPSRHLGLVQACERSDLAAFLDHASGLMERHLDLESLQDLALPSRLPPQPFAPPLPPLGSHVAVAHDAAFAFAYPATLEGWRAAGAEISLFSPLADQSPDPASHAVYLPGGYPELHAGKLAANTGFLTGLRAAAARGAAVLGECGGYMVLGRALVDAKGHSHAMAGLLGLETTFAQRKLHLGYRGARLCRDSALGEMGTGFRGHEFHYASIVTEEGEPLFAITDASGADLGACGLTQGRVSGSFIHLIDRV